MHIPVSVYKLCRNGALICGSSAKILLGDIEGEPKDWDLIVPFDKWNRVADIIGEMRPKANLFGGWKVRGVQGELIDVWPSDTTTYLKESCTKHGQDVVVVDIFANKVFRSSVIDISNLDN